MKPFAKRLLQQYRHKCEVPECLLSRRTLRVIADMTTHRLKKLTAEHGLSASSADKTPGPRVASEGLGNWDQWFQCSRKWADTVPQDEVSSQTFVNAEGTSMKGSTLSWALFAVASLLMVSQSPLRAELLSLPSGSYELTVRLELPHLERWGVDKTTTVCLSNARGPGRNSCPRGERE